MPTLQRKLTAILSADIADYSRLMGDDEAATVATLNAYRDVFITHIEAHRGQVVDAKGDAIDRRITRQAGYTVSMRNGKRVEEIFGWLKTVALMRKTRHRAREKADVIFTFAATDYNLIQMQHLLPAE